MRDVHTKTALGNSWCTLVFIYLFTLFSFVMTGVYKVHSLCNVLTWSNVRDDQIRFFSISLRDIQRLAVRRFKWLRFVMFCTCGAKGQLSATPDGHPVDYDAGITSLTDDDIYYYTAGGKFFFVCKMRLLLYNPHIQRHSFSWTLIV